jgi:hypothetical protein
MWSAHWELAVGRNLEESDNQCRLAQNANTRFSSKGDRSLLTAFSLTRD